MKQYNNKYNFLFLGIFFLCLIIAFLADEYIFISESILNGSINLLIKDQFNFAYLFSGDMFSSSLLVNAIISIMSISSHFYVLLKVLNIFVGVCFIVFVLYKLRGNFVDKSNRLTSYSIVLILSSLVLLISPYSFISFKISMLAFIFFLSCWEKARATKNIKYYIICGVIALMGFSYVLYLPFVVFSIVNCLCNEEENYSKRNFILIMSAAFIVLCGIFFQIFLKFNLRETSNILSVDTISILLLIIGNSIIPNLSAGSSIYITIIAVFIGIIYYTLIILAFKENKNKLGLSLVPFGLIILFILFFDLDSTYCFSYLFFYNILFIFPDLIEYINKIGKKYVPVLVSVAVLVFGVGIVENKNSDIEKEDFLISAYYDSEYIVNVYDVEDIFGCDKYVLSNSLKQLSLNNKIEKYELATDENSITIDKLIPIYGDISYEVSGSYWRFKKDTVLSTFCKEVYLALNFYVPSDNLNNEFVIYINNEEVYRKVAVRSINNILLNTEKYKGKQVFIRINFEKVNYENNFDELCFQMDVYNYLNTSVSTDDGLVDLATIRKIYGFSDNGDGAFWLSQNNLFELYVTANTLNYGLFFTEMGTPNRLVVRINGEVVQEVIVDTVGNQYIGVTLDVRKYINQNVIVEFSFDKNYYPPDYGVQDYRELSAIIVSLYQNN